MGYTYSYEIWVPRARLYDAAAALADHLYSADWYWIALRHERELANLSAVERPDFLRFGECYLCGLCLPEDEHLRDYNEQELRNVRGYNAKITRQRKESQKPKTVSQWWKRLTGQAPPVALPAHLQAELVDEAERNCEREPGLIELFPLVTEFNGLRDGREWLDGEEDLALIAFEGAGSRMSGCMAYSDSVRSWFIALSRAIGAYSCAIGFIEDGLLLYLNGSQFPQGVGVDDLYSPFSLAAAAGHPQSDNARRMIELASWSWNDELSPEQKDRLLRATRDENSGIRAKALKVMVGLVDFPIRDILEAAFDDSDARVRELAVALYVDEFRFGDAPDERAAAPLLRLMRSDASEAVRLQVVRSLDKFPGALDILRDILTRSSAPGDWAMVESALVALSHMSDTVSHEERATIVRAALARPDIAARAGGQRQLEIIETQMAQDREGCA